MLFIDKELIAIDKKVLRCFTCPIRNVALLNYNNSRAYEIKFC